MAEDNTSRFRSVDPASRGSSQAAPANDPLAELARLIGQGQPQPSYPTPTRVPAQPTNSAPRRVDPPAPLSGVTRQDDDPAYRRGAPAPAPRYAAQETQRYSAEPEPRSPARPIQRQNAVPVRPAGLESPRGSDSPRGYSAERTPRYSDADDGWPGSPPPRNAIDPLALPSDRLPTPSRPAIDPLALPSDRLSALSRLAEPQHYASQEFPDPRFQPEPEEYHAEAELNEQGYAPDPAPGPDSPSVYRQEPEDGPMPSLHGDEFYDDAPQGGRRSGLLTVVAVLLLAVVGTAAAFGYRSMFGPVRSAALPPVIRASGEPTKVAPPPAQPDQTVNKFSYDRFGDRGKDEQVVVREEKPVDPRDLAQSTVPRTVLPGGPVAAPAATPSPFPPPPNTAPSALGEPRRVRTVQIRPDQPEPAMSPQTVVAATAPPTAPPAEAMAPPPRSTPPPAARAQSPQRIAPRAATQAPAPPMANAPLSLSPDGNNPPSPSMREGAAPRPAAPTRIAAAPPAAAAGGGYLVQVSSQRSEADAQSAYRNIQSKFGGVLNGQPHLIKRADLGDRGVYYRAMVGPFGSRDQALQLCSNLKAAGGDCVVQAN